MNYFGDEPEKQNSANYTPFSDNIYENNAKVTDLVGAARTNFISRVYSILCIQLAVTVLMTGFSMMSPSYFQFQLTHMPLFYICLVVVIVIEIYIFCCNGGRKFPQSIICTSIFTLCQGYIVSFICSVTGKTSGNSIVFLAAFLTLIIVAACTAYACYSKQDYTASSAIILILFVIMIVLMLVMMFTDNKVVHMIYCGVGVLMFGIYLVIDTQMIMGGKSIELEIDEYYVGALILYIDIVTMFLYILELLNLINHND